MYFKNHHRNLEKMIQLSCITTDYHEEHCSRYIKETEIKILLVLAFGIFGVVNLFIANYELFIIGVVFLLLTLVIIPIVRPMIYSINKIRKISKSDNPLMCFESDIVEIVENKYRSSNGIKYIRYILLDEDIELRISAYQYKEIINKDAKRVKIYFYEELLKEIKVFDLEIVE